MQHVHPVIHAAALTRIYPVGNNRVKGLDAVDLSVNAGELAVIKGESGSGKTTLLSLLAGLDRATSGTLTVAGCRLDRLNGSALTRYRRETVGMVFQSFNLLPTLTVEENVCLPALLAGKPPKPTRARAAELLDGLAMSHRFRHLPGQLSGGEMQRCAIARALINEPAVILADEPTGNLDLATGKEIIQLLGEMNEHENVTIITATHDVKMLAASDRIVWMRDGRIAKVERRQDLDIQIGSVEGDAEGGIAERIRGDGEDEIN